MTSLVGHTNIRNWAASIGILRERIDGIVAASEARGCTWSLDGSPTSSAVLIAHLRPLFNLEGLPDERADQFVAAMNALGPSNARINIAVAVPDLDGLTEGEAIAALEANSLTPAFAYADDTGLDVGIADDDQDPAAEAAALPGATVAVTISLGDPVPNVTGLTLAAATSSIEGASHTVGEVIYVVSDVDPGDVVSQSPSGYADPASAIDLVISGVVVPDLSDDIGRRMGRGLNVAGWLNAIDVAGLVAGSGTEDSEDTSGFSLVIDSDPAPGTVVAPGTMVDYTYTSPPGD